MLHASVSIQARLQHGAALDWGQRDTHSETSGYNEREGGREPAAALSLYSRAAEGEQRVGEKWSREGAGTDGG